MRVAQKVKNFVWQAPRNAMPTKQALAKRTIIANPICERCQVAVEDLLHALWSCLEVDIVWADQTLWDFRCSMDFDNFKQLVLWIIEEGKQLELFAYTAWSVWNQHNQVRMRVLATALHQIPEVSQTILNDFLSKLQDSDTQVHHLNQSMQQLWVPPPTNLVKRNFDGAVFSKENISRIEVVIKDENGLVLGSCTKHLPQAYNARVILEGDSLTVIKALREGEQLLSPTGLLLEDVRMFSQSFETLLYSYSKREGNSVAHGLARYSSSIPDFLVWMEDVPPRIQSLVQADLPSLH